MIALLRKETKLDHAREILAIVRKFGLRFTLYGP